MAAGDKGYAVVRIELEIQRLEAVVTVQESIEDADGVAHPTRKDSRRVPLTELVAGDELADKVRRALQLYLADIARERNERLAAAKRAAEAAAQQAARAQAEVEELGSAGGGG